jgi:hypothetical protein
MKETSISKTIVSNEKQWRLVCWGRTLCGGTQGRVVASLATPSRSSGKKGHLSDGYPRSLKHFPSDLTEYHRWSQSWCHYWVSWSASHQQATLWNESKFDAHSQLFIEIRRYSRREQCLESVGMRWLSSHQPGRWRTSRATCWNNCKTKLRVPPESQKIWERRNETQWFVLLLPGCAPENRFHSWIFDVNDRCEVVSADSRSIRTILCCPCFAQLPRKTLIFIKSDLKASRPDFRS